MTDEIRAVIHHPSRVQLDTRERLTLRVPLSELTRLVSTDMRIVLEALERHGGRLIDWPDAWELVDVTVSGGSPAGGPARHLALVYENTESEFLGVDL